MAAQTAQVGSQSQRGPQITDAGIISYINGYQAGHLLSPQLTTVDRYNISILLELKKPENRQIEAKWHNMKKVVHSYAAPMRRALWDGMLLAAKRQSMTLTEYCAFLWEDDWQAAANLFAKMMPREVAVEGRMEHEHTHKITLTQTLEFIEAALGSDNDETIKLEAKPEIH